MSLAWQRGPLAPGAIGRFLTDAPLPDRLLFAEPARRRMRVRFADTWIVDSDDVVLLHEPGHYPARHLNRPLIPPPSGEVLVCSAQPVEPTAPRMNDTHRPTDK